MIMIMIKILNTVMSKAKTSSRVLDSAWARRLMGLDLLLLAQDLAGFSLRKAAKVGLG